MQITVSDVKEAARKVWPDASEVSGYIIAANGETPKRYCVSAHTENQTLLRRISADDLNSLKGQLDRRLSRKD